MSVQIVRGKKDKQVKAYAAVLEEYARLHPDARVELYRHPIGLIRVRITDPAFARVRWADRDHEVWPLIQRLPPDTMNELGMLVLVTPDEVPTWLGSREFDDPEPLPR